MIAQLNKFWLCFWAGLLPLLWLVVDIFFNNLGANPIQALHIRLGDWALRFLCLTLAITPIQTITKWRGMSNYRQLLGLYAFFYATLHLIVYIVVDHGLVWSLIISDILESSYTWFGIIAYAIVFALAVTSSNVSKKRLGKNWKKLHRFIYLAVIMAVFHYFWQLKVNMAEPLFYLIIVFLLLAFRFLVWLKNRQFGKMMIPKNRD